MPVNIGMQPLLHVKTGRSDSAKEAGICYFSQPRFLKYHIGTTALAAMSAIAYG